MQFQAIIGNAIIPGKESQAHYFRQGKTSQFQRKEGKIRQGKAILGKAIPGRQFMAISDKTIPEEAILWNVRQANLGNST